jgi:hypothetical protein
MDCKHIKELLLSYVDDEVSEEDRKLVEVHLSGCSACAEEMEALAVTGSKLRQAYTTVTARVSPSEGVWESIRSEVVKKQRADESTIDRASSRWGWLFGWRRPVWRVTVAGATATAAGLIVLFMSNGTAPVLTWTAAEQQAIDIALSDPSIQALLDGEGIVSEVIPINDNGAAEKYLIGIIDVDEALYDDLILRGSKLTSEATTFSSDAAAIPAGVALDALNNAVVDVSNNSVVQSYSNTKEIGSDWLSAAQIEAAALIAQSDESLGAVPHVESVTQLNAYDSETNTFSDEIVVWVRLNVDGQPYFSQVDLDEGKVVELVDGGEE